MASRSQGDRLFSRLPRISSSATLDSITDSSSATRDCVTRLEHLLSNAQCVSVQGFRRGGYAYQARASNPRNPKLSEPTRCQPIADDHDFTDSQVRRRHSAMLDDARTTMSIRSFNPYVADSRPARVMRGMSSAELTDGRCDGRPSRRPFANKPQKRPTCGCCSAMVTAAG